MSRHALTLASIGLVSTHLLFAATSAFAQSGQTAAQRLDELKQSTEQMKPPTNPPARAVAPAPQMKPQSAADKRLDEIRTASEQMKPTTNAPARMAEPSPMKTQSAADKQLDELKRRSEQMKPN